MEHALSGEAVIWHDLECGSYRADLPLWRRLAARARGPVLDVGAGTGRVALDLARRGVRVFALERDAELAAELSVRAAGLPLSVLEADACAFEVQEPVPLCIVPMQTIHLLGDRAAFLRCAARALRPGGLLAAALLEAEIEPFELDLEPDEVDRDGIHYSSQPCALRRDRRGTVLLERRREVRAGTRRRSVRLDVQRLAPLDAEQLELEAATAGLRPHERLRIDATDEHAGSEVVILVA